MLTPYQFASNSPIANIDMDGLESYYAANGEYLGKYGESNEIRVIGSSELAKIASKNLSNPKDVNDGYFNFYLPAHSKQAYENTDENVQRLFVSWTNEVKPKIDDNEFAMSLFKKDVQAPHGGNLSLVIPGSTAKGPKYKHGDYAAIVDPYESKVQINGVNLETQFKWERSSTIHNHPSGPIEFDDDYGVFSKFSGDVQFSVKNNADLYLYSPSYPNQIGKFSIDKFKQLSLEKYNQSDPNNLTLKEREKIIPLATDKKSINLSDKN